MQMENESLPLFQIFSGATIAGDARKADFKHADLYTSQSESLKHPNRQNILT